MSNFLTLFSLIVLENVKAILHLPEGCDKDMAKNKLIKPDEDWVGVYVLDALAVKRTVRVRVLVELIASLLSGVLTACYTTNYSNPLLPHLYIDE